MASVWKDKKEVFFLITAHDPTLPLEKVKRKQRDGSIKEVPCLKTVSDYNCFMNGVDRADCMRVQYPTYRMCKRWWTYLFWFCFDLSVANAFILLHESPDHQNNPCKNQLAFRMQFTHLLIGVLKMLSALGAMAFICVLTVSYLITRIFFQP